MTAPTFRLGVLFVHGIGTQPWGEMLVRWGDALIQTITRATQRKVSIVIERAGPREGDDTAAEARLAIDHGKQHERWLLREGWWAASFPPPTYRELVSWGLRALPWAVALHVARRYWREATGGPRAKAVATVRAAGTMLLTLPLTPLVLALLALTLLLGLLPPLRDWALALQSMLTSTMGDTLAFVESPVRAALIRTRIAEQLAALKAECEHTIVIAHSQGAAAVLDALGGIADPSVDEENAPPPAVPEAAMPDTLLTFGAGINQLVSQRVVSAGRMPKLDRGSPGVVVGMALGYFGFVAWLAWSVSTGETSVASILYGLVVVVVTLAITFTIIGAIGVWLERLSTRWTALRRYLTALIVIEGLGMLFVAAQVLPFAETYGVDVDSAMWSLWTTVVLLGSISNLLSKRLEHVVKRSVLHPSGLVRWIDLHASNDPVPNGATASRTKGMPEDVPVWNRGSIVTDHNVYWENVDGFALRVAQACAATAESPWLPRLERDWSTIDTRARWRVGFLRLARASGVLLWVAIGAIAAWTGLFARIPLPFDLPSWLPAPALFAALVAAAGGASHAAVFAIWSRWVRVEQQRALDSLPLVDRGIYPLMGMGAVLWLVFFVALGLALSGLSEMDPNLNRYVKASAATLASLTESGGRVVGAALLLVMTLALTSFLSVKTLLALRPLPTLEPQPPESAPTVEPV
jgi:hypothetical protein